MSQKPSCITPPHSAAYHRTQSFMNCQIHLGGCDCGQFTIANATALVLGDDPNRLFFDQGKVRWHLYQCLEKLLPFPVKRSRRVMKKVGSFDVYCICRMPEMVEGEMWGECAKCLRWYKCPQESDWVCPDCLSWEHFISFCIMHFIFIHAFLSMHFYPCTYMLYVIHALLAHLHCLILASSLFT